MTPKIIVILVTYNGSKWLKRVLEQVASSTLPLELIAVDNNSTDDTVEILASYPGIRLIRQTVNLGFGGANNIAMELAVQEQADYVFLLNQDVYLRADTLEQLIVAHQKHTRYGILSPIQLAKDGIKLDAAFTKYLRRIPAAVRLQKTVLPVRFINAASWLISSECLRKVGLFHPVFFHYGEDNHYASRAQYHGFLVGVVPGVSVIHDRNPVPESDPRTLLRKLQTVPLYTLLDLRKPFWLAFLLAKRKWHKLSRKLNQDLPATRELLAETAKWFADNGAQAKRIRADTKLPWK